LVAFIRRKKVLLIYGYSPFEILKVDTEKGICFYYLTPNIPEVYIERFRGSCIPKKYKNGYIFFIHEIADSNCRLF